MDHVGTKTRKTGRFEFEIENDGHVIVADISSALGGQDKGMDPHELVESALAACTAMTLQMYAERKSWLLESSNVCIKILEEGAETKISRTIEFKGNLDLEQKKKLLEIAEKCPVHKLLVSHISIITTEKIV